MAWVEATATTIHVPSVKTEGTLRGQEIPGTTRSGISRPLLIAKKWGNV